MRRTLVDKRKVYYWSRSQEGKTVDPETTKNHFDKAGIRGILFGEPGYKNPWIQANSTKHFTYLDYDKIYDFDQDSGGYLKETYSGIQKEGGRLLPKFETCLQESGYEGYSRHGEVKYFLPVSVHRDYDIECTRDPEIFWKSIMEVRELHKFSGADKQLTVYSVEEYKGMRLFLSRTGGAGFALNEDNIVSVFSHPFLTPKALPNLMDVAVRNGGARVDVFDTFLSRLYTREGFRAVATIPWNDEYAPDGWDYEKMKQYNQGRPSVVFMVYDPTFRIPEVSSYEEAEEIQQSALRGIMETSC